MTVRRGPGSRVEPGREGEGWEGVSGWVGMGEKGMEWRGLGSRRGMAGAGVAWAGAGQARRVGCVTADQAPTQ